MGSLEPATLVLGVIGAIGTIEFLIWIVVILRDPGFDEFRLHLTPMPHQALLKAQESLGPSSPERKVDRLPAV